MFPSPQAPAPPPVSACPCSVMVMWAMYPGCRPCKQTTMRPQPWMTKFTPAPQLEQTAPSLTSSVGRPLWSLWSPWSGAAGANPACRSPCSQVRVGRVCVFQLDSLLLPVFRPSCANISLELLSVQTLIPITFLEVILLYTLLIKAM